MGQIYTHQTPAGSIHVDIGFSSNDDCFFSGQVWDNKRGLIDFDYKITSTSRTIEPTIHPDTLPPKMHIAILEAVQKLLDELNYRYSRDEIPPIGFTET